MVDQSEVVAMFQAGMSVSDIEVETEATKGQIRGILEEAGLMQRPGRKSAAEGFSAEDRAKMIEEYLDDKVPAVQLIQQYGLSWNAFYKVLDEEHVPHREMKQSDKVARMLRLDRAVVMYEGGARLWEIENETGIRQPVLHAELHRRNITLRRAVMPPDEQV